MIARALIGLCLRPALAVTFAILASLTGAILFAEHTLRDAGAPNAPLIFQIAYNVLVGAFVVSLGSFTGKLTAELDAIRVARMIPGLRRKMRASIVVVAPTVATLALGFLAWTVPAQLQSVLVSAQWSLNVFLFALGLGLGWSWLLPVALLLVATRYGFIVEHLRDTPVAFSAAALTSSVLLVAIWAMRFLAPASAGRGFFSRLGWLKTGSTDALARRTSERPGDAADWTENVGQPITVRRLLKAGVHERHGHRIGAFAGAVVRPVAGAYVLFFLLLAVLATKSPGHDPRGFAESVFTSATVNQWGTIARVSFAAIVGMAAYIAVVTLDTSLRPNLWHPVSRRLQARVLFWSRVRQNLCFSAAHVAIAFLLVAGAGAIVGKWPDAAAWRSFLMPGLAVLLLAPIPQALFPHGGETFQARTSPPMQLGAGLLGGAFCLTTVYWTAHWPTTELHANLTLPAQAALLVAATLVVYGGHWAWVNFRFARMDLTRRSA